MKSKRMPDADLTTLIPLLIGIWRRFHKEAGPGDVLQTREFRGVVAAVQSLQKGLHEDKSLLGKNYFNDPNLLGAYLLYQWVLHYQQGLSLLNELPITPKRVLDICSGPAPMAFAALRHGAHEVIAADQNLAALQLGAEVCGRYGLPLSVRRWNCLQEEVPIEGQFDLIILGHCLEELFPSNHKNWETHQKKFLLKLLHRLTPDGFLLLVDSSFTDSNRRVLQLRDTLVNDGIPIQAPCVWRGQCPALQIANSPCYAQREFEKPYLIKQIQRAAQINLNSLKMSYIIFKSPKAQWPVLTKEPVHRVISPPVESFGGKRYYLCGTDGKKNLSSPLKEHPPESRAFDYLRRGELISIENAHENNHALDIIKDTKVSLEAACGKPINEVLSDF